MSSYPASDHYTDLDFDPSAPIPEIELRFNSYSHVGNKTFMRIARWAIPVVLVLPFVSRALISNDMILFIVSMAYTAALLIFILRSVFRSQRESGFTQAKNDPWGVPIKEQLWVWTVFVLGMCSMFVGLNLVSTDLSSVMNIALWYLGYLGVVFFFAGIFARQPGQISCGACSYPLVGLRLPGNCPECGKQIDTLHDATDRPRVDIKRFVVIGVVLLILSAGTIVYRMYNPDLFFNLMPRNALVNLAATNEDAFRVLIDSSMTPEEEEQLIIEILEADEQWGEVIMFDRLDWIKASVLQGRLSPEQFARVINRLPEPYIDAPKRVQVSERVSVMLRADRNSSIANRLHPSFYFSGYQLNKDPKAYLKGNQPRRFFSLTQGTVSDRVDGSESPQYRFVADEAGEVNIHTRLVLVLFPTMRELEQSGFAWHVDGSHSFETQPIWESVIDLEHTIEVID